MVPEAPLEQTEHGLVPKGKGWFVLNAREAAWIDREGRGAVSRFEGFEGEADFSQLGINIRVLGPGEPMSMYHWEADQEDFLVISGEALAIVEGEERPMRPWDLLHCPAGAEPRDRRRRRRPVHPHRRRCARQIGGQPGLGWLPSR